MAPGVTRESKWWLDDRMWFFPKKVAMEADDPIFGLIRFDRHWESWNGRMHIPGLADSVPVTIEAGTGGPSERQRTVATRFAEKFSELLPQLQAAVFDEHRRYHESQTHVEAIPCPVCRYDLRATPERCPECGTVFASPDSSSAAGIWSSLKLRDLTVVRDRNDTWPELELLLDFDAPWDEEHGLQLAIGGNELLQVGA